MCVEAKQGPRWYIGACVAPTIHNKQSITNKMKINDQITKSINLKTHSSHENIVIPPQRIDCDLNINPNHDINIDQDIHSSTSVNLDISDESITSISKDAVSPNQGFDLHFTNCTITNSHIQIHVLK